MGLKTIGYAVSYHNSEFGSQMAPIVFQGDADLELDWVGVIYPKAGKLLDSLKIATTQLANYIAFYKNESVLVIGGDQTALLGVGYGVQKPASFLWFVNEPSRIVGDGSFSLIEEMMSPSALKMELPNNMVGLSIISGVQHEFDIQNVRCSTWDDFDIDQWYASQGDHDVVVCVDVTGMSDKSFSLIKKCLECSPKALVLIGYCPNLDAEKNLYQQLKGCIEAIL